MSLINLKTRASAIASNAANENVKALAQVLADLCDQFLRLERAAHKAERKAEQAAKRRPAPGRG
jgi:hypothetical protein